MLRHRRDTRSLSLFLEVIGHSLVLVWGPRLEAGVASDRDRGSWDSGRPKLGIA
jgi:hypothetical protein